MPSRNLEKVYLEHAFYHVYNRGVNKRLIFKDAADYAVFLNLFKRYLNNRPALDNKGRQYVWLHGSIELVAFCLMPNHFHALIYQSDPQAMSKLFKAITTTYAMYFNKKYKRVGPLFQSRFRASMITNDAYLEHISRYIHRNPNEYQTWPYSSLCYYTGKQTAAWVRPDRILEIFNNNLDDYQKFVADYESYQNSLDQLAEELAD